MKYLYKKIIELELSAFYKHLLLNNNGDKNKYHNNFHIESVSLFSLKGCEYYNIESNNQRLILAASLFHDFNHSGGKLSDDENIDIAINSFKEFNTTFNKNEEETIIKLIKSTRYPYISKSDDLTLLENILRDSDILQGIFCQNYINGVSLAISKEIGIDPITMISGQINFLKSQSFGTKWANDLYSTFVSSKIEEVELIKKILC